MDWCENLCSLSMAWWCYVGGMEWGLLYTWRDAYGHIYGLPFLYLAFPMHLIYCIGIWSYVANLWFRPYWQFHTLLGMKAGDMVLHCIAFTLWFWDMRCVPWSMALGVIGRKWSLSKDWWWLILLFMWLYYLIRYIWLFLIGVTIIEI